VKFTEWQSSFNLENGPLYSIGYLHGYTDKTARIFFALHHLIVDAVSWRTLTEDLKDLYEGRVLGPKGSSYRQWVKAIQSYKKFHRDEVMYWKTQLSDYRNELLYLQDEISHNIGFELSYEQTQLFLRECNKAYNTQANDVLLTALGYSLAEITSKSIVHIVLEGHGREELNNNLDVSRTVGWFTTLYPVRLEIRETLIESLKNIKEILRRIPNKGIGYGTIIGYETEDNTLPFNLPKVSFNYLGQFDKKDMMWNITHELSGLSIDRINEDHYLITINCFILSGILKFYITSKLGLEITNKLSKILANNINELIKLTTDIGRERSYLTISDVDMVVNQNYLDKLQKNKEIEGLYLANSLQQGFIYHALHQGNVDDAYLGQGIWQYCTVLDVELLKKAWEYMQVKYPSLRLRFAWEEELVQVIDKKGILDWRYIDISETHENVYLESEEQKQANKIAELIQADRVEPFKLEHGHLFRVYLIKQREDLYTCIFSNHHAIIDGWSDTILLSSLHETYLDLLDNNKIIPWIDSAYGKTQKYIQENDPDSKKYWENYIAKIELKPNLNGLLSNESRQNGIRVSDYRHVRNPQTKTLIIKDDLYRSMKELSQNEGVTLNVILQYVWHKILHLYGNSKQTVVGTVIAGRNIPIDGIENSVGLYVNTLPLIVEHGNRNSSIIDIIKNIQNDINEINSRSNINLAKLQKESERLFDSLFAYQNYPAVITQKHQNRLNINVCNPIEKVDYPLWLLIYEKDNTLILKFTYAAELFENQYIHSILALFKRLLEQVVTNYKQPTYCLTFLDVINPSKSLMNKEDDHVSEVQTIHELFERQVVKNPDNIALVHNIKRLTYKLLNERANQLAHYLLQKYLILPDTLVALCLDKNENLVLAILAVLKAGAAYVPIDPNYPSDRIAYVVKDTSAKLILTNKKYKQKLHMLLFDDTMDNTKQNTTVEILPIDNNFIQKQLDKQKSNNPKVGVNNNHLIYTIYTSGTTGYPKGVLQTHGNIIRLFRSTEQWYQFNIKDIWILSHSYVFDFTVWEMWGALIYGGKLIIPSYDQTRDIAAFYILCKKEEVTILNQTPTVFYQFQEIASNEKRNRKNELRHLRCIIFGGEALNIAKLAIWFEKYGFNSPQLINMYGITETTVHATYKPISAEDFFDNSNIGTTLPDLEAYILNNALNPMPLGAVGELYIGGDCLARGYLNNPNLTAEKFIPNPFLIPKDNNLTLKNLRLYKTGDLVRRLSNGEFEYIGRQDQQVKIRGYRIELEEIESTLGNYPGIKHCIVALKDKMDQDGVSIIGKYLVAYYIKDLSLENQDISTFIQTWENLYEDEYESLGLNDFRQNIQGWNSSYTGEAIAKQYMLEWVDATVTRIKELAPKVILEIGSGSGLILFNMIEECNYYYANDFSQNAILYTKKIIQKYGYKDKVTAIFSAAHDLPYETLNKGYDTVIMNSVVQYFPNLDYLESIINKAISNMPSDGQIFIGDIRDYRLLNCFNYSVQKYKYQKVTKSTVAYFARRENELLIAPEYFLYLGSINSYITNVEIMPKLGKADHEMNRYRYDVILHIRKNIEKAPEEIHLIEDDFFMEVEDLNIHLLMNKEQNILGIKYPNKRILNDYLECNALCGEELTIGLFSNGIDLFKDKNILELYEIREVLEEKKYVSKFYLDVKDPLYLNIVAYKEPFYKDKKVTTVFKAPKGILRQGLANNPVLNAKLLENQFNKELKVYLSNKLPEYMVPEHYVLLESLPRTINGKLDKKALPEPELIDIDNYLAPRNTIEQEMCRIWGEVLGIPENKVGINDNFFRLGGDSIVSIQVISRMRHSLGTISVSVKDIFNYKTIGKLYDNILSKESSHAVTVRTEQGLLSGNFELLPVQQWFFNNLFSNIHYFNQAFLIKIPTKLDIGLLKIAIDKLLKYHDTFRLRFKTDSNTNNYIQYYDTSAVNIEKFLVLDINTLSSKNEHDKISYELAKIFTKWQNSFNIERGPTYTFGYVEGYHDGSSRIFFACHHLMIDTVSWRILLHDLQRCYYGGDLGSKCSSYRQWVEVVGNYANSNPSELSYWCNVLADFNESPLMLISRYSLNSQHFELNYNLTQKLLKEANSAYNTKINDILLTALGYTLWEILEQKVNHIIFEGHGRVEIDKNIDILRTIGWFTTFHPVRLEVYKKIDQSIKNIKETLRQVPNQGVGYGALLGYKPDNMPKIVFNYLGQFNNSQEKDTSAWDIIVNDCGVSIDPKNVDLSVISIDGMLIEDTLSFSITSRLQPEITSKLSNSFKSNIEKIILYLSELTRSYITKSDVANIISQEYLDALQKPQEIDGIYMANSLQQGFIYHSLFHGQIDDAYIVQIIWEYHCELHVEYLRHAWALLQIKYDALRLRFAWEEELIQIIDKQGKLDWRYIDLSKVELNKEMFKKKISNLIRKDRKERYQLEKSGLFRVYIIKQDKQLYTSIFSHHHAILDGWSIAILLRNLHDIYQKVATGKTVLPTVDYSYREAQKYLQLTVENNLQYWQNYILKIDNSNALDSLLSVTEINDRQILLRDYKYIKYSCEVSVELDNICFQHLKNFCRNNDVTLSVILLYLWHKTLSIYSNTSQTVTGVTVSGRNLPINNIENSIGLYINTLPFIVDHSLIGNSQIIDVINSIQNELNELNNRSNVNLSMLQSGGKRLFDCIFVYENYPNPLNTEQDYRKALRIKFKDCIEKLDYPLGLMAYETKNGITCILRYAAEIFAKDKMKNMLSTMKTLANQVAPGLGQVNNLRYLSIAQTEQIIYRWNDTDIYYPHDKTLTQLFQEQVARTPHDIAIIYRDRKYTYTELNEKGNQLVHLIKKYNINSDNLIALYLERNEYMVIAMLGVLKSGCAYVPIDLKQPSERIKYILQDIRTDIIITNEIHQEKITKIISELQPYKQSKEIIVIDNLSIQKELSTLPVTSLNVFTTSQNLAYAIYTSGTTGNPKGVMVEHRSIVNTLTAQRNYLNLESFIKTPIVFGLFVNYAFDVSVSGIFLPLLSGYRLLIIDELSRLSNIEIKNIINQNQVNVAHSALVIEMLNEDENTSSLKCLIVGGEKSNKVHIDRLISLGVKVFQEYGLTESSVVSTFNQMKQTDNISNIGSAISNNKYYVLDKSLALLPVDAIGELYIGGVGLARGYINKPELTALKFIPNLFQTEEEKIR
jgi:amino acid adenylation domain-containing protein/non-ribosomal peptide synthase protein (TIGR01720 family)